MTAYIVRVQSDTEISGDEWQITVKRCMPPLSVPRPDDLPPDIVDAIADWLAKRHDEEGITR